MLERARHAPYELGVHDCFRVACQVVEALTGVDRWHEFSGYRTRKEALARIAQHGASFIDAASWFFGAHPVALAYARRGDVVAFFLGSEYHLGIVTGKTFFCVAEEGILDLPMQNSAFEKPLFCWGVG